MSNSEMSNGLSAGAGRSRFLEWWRSVTQSLTLRMALIGFVALVMLIPLAAVHDLVRERSRLHDSALSDIASIWGGEQVVKGPALVVPFVERYLIEETETDEDGNERTRTKTEDCQKTAVFLPKELELEFHLDEEYRHRAGSTTRSSTRRSSASSDTLNARRSSRSPRIFTPSTGTARIWPSRYRTLARSNRLPRRGSGAS